MHTITLSSSNDCHAYLKVQFSFWNNYSSSDHFHTFPCISQIYKFKSWLYFVANNYNQFQNCTQTMLTMNLKSMHEVNRRYSHNKRQRLDWANKANICLQKLRDRIASTNGIHAHKYTKLFTHPCALSTFMVKMGTLQKGISIWQFQKKSAIWTKFCVFKDLHVLKE